MNADSPDLPEIPVWLDDALHAAMMDAVGQRLAFRAVDAAWRVMVENGIFLGPSVTRSPELVIPLETPDA